MRNLVVLIGSLLLLSSCSRTGGQQQIEFAQVRLNPTPPYVGGMSEDERAEKEGVWLSLEGIYALDRRTVFVYGRINSILGRSVLLRSGDGGQTWREVMPSVPAGSVLRVTFLENGFGWAIAARTVGDLGLLSVYRSVDYGQGWEWVSSIQNDRGFPYGIKFFDPEHGQIKMIYYTANPYSDRLAVLTTVDGGQEWRETESTPIWEEWDGVSAVQMRIHLTDEEEVRDRFWELAGWSVLEEGCYEECESAGWDGSRWRLSREGVESYIVSMCLAAEGNWIEVTRIPRNYRYFKGKVLLVEE